MSFASSVICSPTPFIVTRDAATSSVQVDGTLPVGVVSSNLARLIVESGLGDDTVQIEGSNGPSIEVIGDRSTVDQLVINNAQTGSTSVNPGVDIGAGMIASPDGVPVRFWDVDSVSISAADAADHLTVMGGNTADAFAVASSLGNRIWLNNREVLSFDTFGEVTLNGLQGADWFTVSPIGLDGVSTVNINGGGPLGSDTVEVVGDANSNDIGVEPTAIDAGRITTAGSATVVFTSTESAEINGHGGDDTVTVTTPAIANWITLLSGDSRDDGRVLTEGLVPVAFTHLGSGGSLALADAGGRSDTLVHDGSDRDDAFGLDSALTLNGRIPVSVAGITSLILNGLGGDDAVDVQFGHGVPNVELSGGGNTNDSVTLTGDGTEILAAWGSGIVSGAGLGTVAVGGMSNALIDASAGDIDVLGSTSDDRIDATPTGTDSGHISVNGNDTELHFANAGSVTVDASSGHDILTFHGSAGPDVISADDDSVELAGRQIIDFTGTESLNVLGWEGEDAFNVTPGSVGISLDGGDPRLAPAGRGDTLTVSPGTAQTQLVSDHDGGVYWTDGAEPVSFTGIERSTVDGGIAVIDGTNGSDHIFVVSDDSIAGQVTVMINDQAPQVFQNVNEFILQTNNGSDTIEVLTTSAGATNLTIDGGLGGDDTLIVHGSSQADTIVYSPNESDNESGSLTVNAATVQFSGVSSLSVDGGDGDDSLTANGTSADDRIMIVPGVDASGAVMANSSTTVSFESLENASIDGGQGSDHLQVWGTDGQDAVTLNGTSVSVNGQTFGLTGHESVSLLTGADNDQLNVSAASGISVQVDAGDVGEGNSVRFIGQGGGVEFNIANASVTESGLGTVSLDGVSNLMVDAANATLSIVGTSRDDGIVVTPLAAGDANIATVELGFDVDVTNALLLSIDTGSGTDWVEVHGNSGSNDIDVVRGTATSITVDSLLPVNVTSIELESLLVTAGLGDDFIR